MAFSLIAHTIKQTTDKGNVTTDAVDTTGANLIVLVTTRIFVTPGPTDSYGNTWTVGPEAFSNLTSPQIRESLYYCYNPSVGPGHTFSENSGGSTFPVIAMVAFSGAAASPLDKTARNPIAGGGSVGSIQAGSVTPSQDNELLIAAVGDAITDTTLDIDSSFNLLDQLALVSGTAYSLGIAYKIQTTAGAENPTWSWSPNARAGAVIATFKAAVAPPLTSVMGNGSAGTMVAGSELAITGVEVTGSAGTAVAGLSPELFGVGAAGEVGTLGVASLVEILLSGVGALGALGNLGVEADSNVTVALTGVASSGDVGTLGVQGTVYPPTPFEVQVLMDGPRYAAIKAASTLGVPLALSTLIDPAELSSIIPGWPTDRKASQLSIDIIEFTIDPGLEISLWWDAGTPKLICELQNWGSFDTADIDNNALDPTGIILISTSGTGSFSLLMRFLKQGGFA